MCQDNRATSPKQKFEIVKKKKWENFNTSNKTMCKTVAATWWETIKNSKKFSFSLEYSALIAHDIALVACFKQCHDRKKK